jgi:Phage capsid family
MLGTNRTEAVELAEAAGANQSVITELKTASPATTSGSLSSPYAIALERMISNNSPRGVFEAMKAGMTQVPLRSRLLLSAATITAAETTEGAAKLVRRLSLQNLDTEIAKLTTILGLSSETLLEAPELAQRLIASALREAINRAVDAWFLGKLAVTNSGESSSEVNPSWALMLADLQELATQVQTGDASRLFWIFPPRIAKALSRAAYENGISTVKYDSGEIFGIRILTSQSQQAGRITLADASAIVYADDGLSVRSSSQAALEFSDTSTQSSASPTATSLTDCFSTNTRAIAAEKRVAARVVDVNGVASLTGVQWGSCDSPATP